MTDIVTPCPMYIDDIKIGDATQGDYSVDSGMGMMIADKGTAFSKGRVTCTASVNTIIPRAGMQNRLFETLIGQKLITLRILIDGKYHSFKGCIKTGKGSWNFAKGECTGDFSFEGTDPDVQG